MRHKNRMAVLSASLNYSSQSLILLIWTPLIICQFGGSFYVPNRSTDALDGFRIHGSYGASEVQQKSNNHIKRVSTDESLIIP